MDPLSRLERLERGLPTTHRQQRQGRHRSAWAGCALAVAEVEVIRREVVRALRADGLSWARLAEMLDESKTVLFRLYGADDAEQLARRQEAEIAAAAIPQQRSRSLVDDQEDEDLRAEVEEAEEERQEAERLAEMLAVGRRGGA